MDTENLYSIIQELDSAIGKLSFDKKDQEALCKLLELRNNLLIKYKPDPNIDWTIKNKRAQKILTHFQWTAIYKD
jgi:hypothetical protein